MKKTKKAVFTILMIVGTGFLILACNDKHKTENINEVSSTSKIILNTEEQVDIIGKTGTITFPEFKVEETFISDSILHWKIINEKGEATEGDEKVSFKKLNNHQFFVNWIEKTGLTVSQVLDVKNQTATAFVSREDKKSERGQRSANFFEGGFKINE